MMPLYCHPTYHSTVSSVEDSSSSKEEEYDHGVFAGWMEGAKELNILLHGEQFRHA
jgi:hypothetical protein